MKPFQRFIFSFPLLVLNLVATPALAEDEEITAPTVPTEGAEAVTDGAAKKPDEAQPGVQPQTRRTRGDRLNVNSIKKKYWARGDDSEIGVVQNRRFSKDGRFQIGLMGGINFSDPFLNVKVFGLGMGYHFNETFSLNILGWKHMVSPSSALTTFQETRGATTNTNEPQSYYGGEATGSFLYGKLAFFGAKIIYYDMNVAGGLGLTKTESGSYITPSVGLGQRFFLNQNFSLRFDYRLMVYKEDILEKQITNQLGQKKGDRTNFSNNIMLGIDFLFGGQ